MIRAKSDDPDVSAAAADANAIVRQVLSTIHHAETFDYGGHMLRLGEYDICKRCTGPIATAQLAYRELTTRADQIANQTVKAHVERAAELFRLEAEAAKVRAEFHNGDGTELILNDMLGFLYDHDVHDSYDHSHHGGH